MFIEYPFTNVKFFCSSLRKKKKKKASNEIYKFVYLFSFCLPIRYMGFPKMIKEHSLVSSWRHGYHALNFFDVFRGCIWQLVFQGFLSLHPFLISFVLPLWDDFKLFDHPKICIQCFFFYSKLPIFLLFDAYIVHFLRFYFYLFHSPTQKKQNRFDLFIKRAFVVFYFIVFLLVLLLRKETKR